nr:MAG TPA: hypothetical protein [Caudoviricetes sp.]
MLTFFYLFQFMFFKIVFNSFIYGILGYFKKCQQTYFS